jgi:hypothetical protein
MNGAKTVIEMVHAATYTARLVDDSENIIADSGRSNMSMREAVLWSERAEDDYRLALARLVDHAGGKS